MGEGMADIPGAEVSINGLRLFHFRPYLGDPVFDHLKQRVQRGAFSKGHVIDLVQGIGVFACSRKDVGLDGVIHKAEIPGGFTIAIDVGGLSIQERREPFGDHRGIGAVGVLRGPKREGLAQILICELRPGFLHRRSQRDGSVVFAFEFEGGVIHYSGSVNQRG